MGASAVKTDRPGWRARYARISHVQAVRFRARVSQAQRPSLAKRLAEMGCRAEGQVAALYLAGEIGDREALAAVELERRHWMAARVLGASTIVSSDAPAWYYQLPRPRGVAARDCLERYRALTSRLGEACSPLVLRELLGAALERRTDGSPERIKAGLEALAAALEGEAC